MTRARKKLNGPIVLDASVALKWVLPEDDSDIASRLHEWGPLHAPDVLLIESANALWVRVRRGDMTPADAKAALADIAAAPVAFTRDHDRCGSHPGIGC